MKKFLYTFLLAWFAALGALGTNAFLMGLGMPQDANGPNAATGSGALLLCVSCAGVVFTCVHAIDASK